MTELIQPALSKEEWFHLFGKLEWQSPEWEPPLDGILSSAVAAMCNSEVPPERRHHALAAIALYQQPFGFTHADVDELESTLESTAESSIPSFSVAERGAILSIAARIRCLLPPPAETPTL
jgi:hypothetical protein